LLVAKELSYYPEKKVEVKENPKHNRRNSTKKVQEKRKKSSSFAKLVILSIPMFGLGIALFILFGYANITAVRHEITKLETQKIRLEKEKLDLIAELEGIKSSTKISEDAITKLGMDYPSEGQIVYVTVEENIIKDKEKPGIDKQIKKMFSMVTNLF